jgi:Immunoglobulin-like domain of bacterial spore germination
MGTNRRPTRVSKSIRTATVVLVIGLAAACGTESRPQSNPSALSPTTTTSSSTSTTTTTSTTSTAEPARDPLGGLPALWPFSTLAEARQWQAQGEGHSPWHLDAEATAVFFTTGYLGFAGVDKVLDSQITATDAKVTIGYQGDLPKPAPAAVLHLVRYGDGPTAPWQVVGTVDTMFTITSPAPNAQVTSPVKVDGVITGLDESIEVQVRDPDLPTPVGKSCCVPAGGENSPWSTTVPLKGMSNTTLTIVAATGGHAADVERFAVTGVRVAG